MKGSICLYTIYCVFSDGQLQQKLFTSPNAITYPVNILNSKMTFSNQSKQDIVENSNSELLLLGCQIMVNITLPSNKVKTPYIYLFESLTTFKGLHGQ